MPRLVVLDAMGLVYRAHHALLVKDRGTGAWGPLRNKEGEAVSAIYGMANTLLKIRREQQPDYWALAWDGPGPTLRHRRYPAYKATRPPMPDDLLQQIPAIEQMAAALGLPLIELPEMEADDVMATLAARGEREGFEVLLVTSDKDLLQLVSAHVHLLSPVGRGEDYRRVDPEAVREQWGVPPEQIRDVLALMGDTSDNVPGVPGVGEKTAVDLIRRFGSLDTLYQRLAEVDKNALRARLEKHREQAWLSRELVTVHADLEIPQTWEQLQRGAIRREPLLDLARRFQLTRLEKLAVEEGVSEAELAAETAPRPLGPPEARDPAPGSRLGPGPQGSLELFVAPAPGDRPAGFAIDASLDALVTRLHEVRARSIHGLALWPIAERTPAGRATVVGWAFAARDGTSCYVPLAHDQGPNLTGDRFREWLGPVLADRAVPKVGVDLKRDRHLLAGLGLELQGLWFDLHLGSFLCDPERDHRLPVLSAELLGRPLPPLEPAPARGRERSGHAALPVGWAAAAAIARAEVLFPLEEALRAQLEAREQWKLYRDLEHPLIDVLFDMERAGVRVDGAVLDRMREQTTAEIARLESELQALAGEPVNLQSGPQISRLLFEKLGLRAGRRTKTGHSTDQAVLESLSRSHPFPGKLLEYRALTKLSSTYLETLPQAVDSRDGRVHTTFHQAGAATGRLSSSDPNLQNIPMRTAMGRELRRAFVAREGACLIGADYSQIELRVMAHLSGDPRLIEAFQSGQDVHESTARQVFGVPDGPLDPELRARAKVVNFGIMYGMGARSLASQLDMEMGDAQEFIRDYFAVYSRVREFLDHTVEEAGRRGYVQTLLGRRRFLPGLDSGHGGERSLAERVAINAPIQGTAADLMKLAMIRVHRALKESHPSARLLLQVHDELLIECPIDEADAAADRVRAEMEGCYPLRVPLRVTVGRGATWFDVH